MLSDTRYKYFLLIVFRRDWIWSTGLGFLKGEGGGDFSHIGIKKVKDYS